MEYKKRDRDESVMLEGEYVVLFAEALDKPRFTSKDVSAMTGVLATRISQWIARGQLRTEHVPAGTGHPRLFSVSELGKVVALQVLLDAGIEAGVAVNVSWSVGHNFRAHFIDIARKIYNGVELTKDELLDIQLDSICINTVVNFPENHVFANLGRISSNRGGHPYSNEHFSDTVPFGEVLAGMGESFLVINTAKVFGRTLVPHASRVLNLIIDEMDEMIKNTGTAAE